MATETLPTRTDISRYVFRIDLDDVTFGIDLRFNTRDQHWYLTLQDADGNPLRQGIKIVGNWQLLRTMVQQGRPLRDLIAIRPSGSGDPDRETLGVDSFLSYAP